MSPHPGGGAEWDQYDALGASGAQHAVSQSPQMGGSGAYELYDALGASGSHAAPMPPASPSVPAQPGASSGASNPGALQSDVSQGSQMHDAQTQGPQMHDAQTQGPQTQDASQYPPILATVPIRCVVNGKPVEVPQVWVADSLLFLLRERLGLGGAKDGCGEGECGACVVLLDGEPVLGCLTPALAAEGSYVTTVEAYGDGDEVSAALASHCGAGCGYCLPGIGLSVRTLLARQPEPSESAIRESLSGHLCRCLPPGPFIDAVREAAATRAAQGLGGSGSHDVSAQSGEYNRAAPRG